MRERKTDTTTAAGRQWRASAKTVEVRCPSKGCETGGVAAENAITETTPHSFRATCPEHDTALVRVKA